MMVLYCNDLLEPRKVDPDFEGEWLCARELGMDTSLLSFESLVDGDMDECLKRVEGPKAEQLAVYRGWMLTP